MRKSLFVLVMPAFVSAFLMLVLQGCSTTSVSFIKDNMVIKSITVTPEVVAPGGYVLVSIEGFDTDGNEIYFRVGTTETFPLSKNKFAVIQAPSKVGTNEIKIIFTNGRTDIFRTIKVYVDGTLQSTIRSGRTTLPMNKSFDFLTGSIKDQYYGDMDFSSSYYGGYYLSFAGNGSGDTLPYSYFDGGIVNLTFYSYASDLSKVFYPYDGYYLKEIFDDSYYEEKRLIANNNYCVWFMRGAYSYFAKVRIIEFGNSGITFDWVVQTDPNKRRFYD